MGCLKLRYQEKEDQPNFLAVWKKYAGKENCKNYYPFGLTFNSYSRESSVKNKYLYNAGSELQDDLGLNVFETPLRMYDPAMDRWWQVDPMVDEFYSESPYLYSHNNPIRYNDPKGDCPTGDCPEEEMADVIAATVSDGIKGLGNIILAPFGKELSNEGNGITLTMQERQAPTSVGEAFLKPVENALNATSILPSSGPTSMLLAKTGPAVKNLAADAVGGLNKSLKQQGADLAKANNGNRVTLRSDKLQVDADVAGKSHFNKSTKTTVETPHMKVSPRNANAPNQPAYNTKGIQPVSMTQKDIRMIRKYLESLPKSK